MMHNGVLGFTAAVLAANDDRLANFKQVWNLLQ